MTLPKGWKGVPKPKTVEVEYLHTNAKGWFDTIRTVHREELKREPGTNEYNDHLYWILTQRDGGWTAEKIRTFVQSLQEWKDQRATPPPPVVPPRVIRRGPVRGEGRHWVDDDGRFYPLGGSLFWGVRGERHEPQRFDDNLEFLSRHDVDFVRMLGSVAGGPWTGNEVDPRWPDYRTVLAKAIDHAYMSGLRTELTMIGGGIPPNPDGSAYDYMDLTDKVIEVVRDRKAKVLGIEVANEFQVKDVDLMWRIVAKLRAALPDVLVAATDATNAPLGGEVPGTNACFQNGATYGTLHLQRAINTIEREWRPVRQSWDFKEVGRPLNANEPIGPLSSVAMDFDPMRLACNRAVSILNGVGAWVLHNGAGIYGQPNTHPAAGFRPPNLWETQGIDRILNVVRGIDRWIPLGVEDWRHYNHGWAGEPLHADSIWIDANAKKIDAEGNEYGVVRHYQAKTDTQFFTVPIGIKHHVNLTAAAKCRIDIIDVVDGVVGTELLEAGQSFRLEPHTRDNNNWGSVLLMGTLL